MDLLPELSHMDAPLSAWGIRLFLIRVALLERWCSRRGVSHNSPSHHQAIQPCSRATGYEAQRKKEKWACGRMCLF
ncbi:uncharacterized [Tachysurus ichikawai]